MEFALRKVGCRGLVAAAHFKTQNYFDMIRQVAPEIENCLPGRLKSKRYRCGCVFHRDCLSYIRLIESKNLFQFGCRKHLPLLFYGSTPLSWKIKGMKMVELLGFTVEVYIRKSVRNFYLFR